MRNAASGHMGEVPAGWTDTSEVCRRVVSTGAAPFVAYNQPISTGNTPSELRRSPTDKAPETFPDESPTDDSAAPSDPDRDTSPADEDCDDADASV
jgi:hypothetical protein